MSAIAERSERDGSIAERLVQVQQRIAAAAKSAGREPSSVRLIAVSKTHGPDAIRAAYAAGQREFGENYVQELSGKGEQLADLSEIRWHMIGHLQKNKARKIVRLASTIHTVDSPELVSELAKRVAESPELPEPLRVLVEVNIASEPQKRGVSKDALSPLLAAIERERALRLLGLMCVPPITDTPEQARPYFDALVRLRDANGGALRLPDLSMGMTFDLEPAIAAGATLVRVGTAIFGKRIRPPTISREQ